MNEYLMRKQQPSTEEEFYERYKLEMKKASILLKKLHETYKHQNPWAYMMSYSRSYCPALLTFFFEAAGKDYEGIEKRIEETNCDRIPLHYFIAAVCNVSNQEVEDVICGRK